MEGSRQTDALTQPLLQGRWPASAPATTPPPSWSYNSSAWVENGDADTELDKETLSLLHSLQQQEQQMQQIEGGVTESIPSLARQRSLVRRKQRRFAGSRQSSAVSSFSSLPIPGPVPGPGPGPQQDQEAAAGGRWGGCLECVRWPARKWRKVQAMAGGPLAFPFKAGLAATLASMLCFLPPLYSNIDQNGVWAVVTVDIVLEASVGLTFSKGLNRTVGTLVAAMLALFVNLSAPSFGSYETYFIVFCVFLGAAIPTVFKFRRPFKDKWNYAVVMSMITFHLLILSKSAFREKLALPLVRLVTIFIGFLVALLVNLSLAPAYAGDMVNKLVAKNFHTAGNVVEGCVRAYCNGVVLDPVPETLRKKTPVDNIFTSFYEILAADSDVDKLMKAVPFEPCHGNFFWGFPWDLYSDIIDNLRYELYDVIALDACLRAEIQAPTFVRFIFREELQVIGHQCGVALRLMGATIRNMRRYHHQDVVQKAEEAALLLQHKIRKHSRILLGENPLSNPGTGNSDAIPIPGATNARPPRPQHPHPNPDGEESDAADATFRPDWQSELFQHSDSLGPEWDATIQRIAALSFVKFSSLLIELVAKTKYILTMVDELSARAAFPLGDREQTQVFHNEPEEPV